MGSPFAKALNVEQIECNSYIKLNFFCKGKRALVIDRFLSMMAKSW